MSYVQGERPAFCILEQCTPIVGHMNSGEILAKGNSGFCIGENSEVQEWTSGEVTHINDLCFCSYTPFKGWVKFVMNNGDLDTIYKLIERFSDKTGRSIV